MAKHMNKGLPYLQWPPEDRAMFDGLSGGPDIFDDAPWSALSPTSVRNRRYAYSHWLGFLTSHQPTLLSCPLLTRVTPATVKGYVEELRRNCTETAISIELQRLHLTLTAADPDGDWAWLYSLQRRIARAAKRLPKQRVYSVDLYRIGTEMMEDAKNKSALFGRTILSQAEQFRDGLMIAMLAEAPMRRAGFAALCLGEHVIKIAGRWRIYLQSDMVKTRMEQDFDLSEELGGFVDEYLLTFRPAFANVDQHSGMWPYGDRPMTDKMVRRYISKHTKERLGFAVSPHGFRRAAATYMAAADPQNVRAVKDLLGHRSFAMTEKHYVDAASSRMAGGTLATIIASLQSDLDEADRPSLVSN